MNCHCTHHPEDATIRVSGHVDLRSVAWLETAFGEMVAEGRGPVTLDLAAVDYLDGVGVRAIIGLYKKLRAAGRPLVLRGPRGQVAQLIHCLRLDSLVPVLGANDIASNDIASLAEATWH